MPRGTKRVRTPSAATGGREGVPDNGFRGKVHERKGYKDGVPTPMNIELFSIAMRHTATYREMDALLRQVTKKDGGHGSTFTVHKGSQDDQVRVSAPTLSPCVSPTRSPTVRVAPPPPFWRAPPERSTVPPRPRGNGHQVTVPQEGQWGSAMRSDQNQTCPLQPHCN